MKIHHASTIEEAINIFESFLVCDLWYACKSEWKNEKDMIKYIKEHFKIFREEIKIATNKKSKIKRQGLTITLNQLYNLIDELQDEFEWDGNSRVTDDNRKFQINIINKTPECSDTWEIENQQKKDKDDGSNVSLSGDTKQLQGKKNKDEHMPVDVDNHVDTDALTKTSNEASRIDGRRLSSKLNDRIDS